MGKLTYRYRDGNSVIVNAGDEITNDIQTREGRINSLVRDEAGNWSSTGGIDVIISSILGVNDSNDTTIAKAFVYPNPTDGSRLFLNYKPNAAHKTKITILDLSGHVINTIEYQPNDNELKTINLSRYVTFYKVVIIL